MSLNEEIQMSLLVFIQSKVIKNCEFQSLKELFFAEYPQYRDSTYYHQLYRSLQKLCKKGYITVDKSKSPFKYSSKEISRIRNIPLINELRSEVGSLNFTIYTLNCELFWYSKYIEKYPNLTSEIKLDIEKVNKQLYSVSSHKKVLNNIINHLNVE